MPPRELCQASATWMAFEWALEWSLGLVVALTAGLAVLGVEDSVWRRANILRPARARGQRAVVSRSTAFGLAPLRGQALPRHHGATVGPPDAGLFSSN